jgi:hypothetical protein
MEDKIKEYIKRGGKVFYITKIDTLRDGGTMVIKTSLGDDSSFYVSPRGRIVHSQYPLNDENMLRDKLLQIYLLDRLETFLKLEEDAVEHNKNMFREVKYQMGFINQ